MSLRSYNGDLLFSSPGVAAGSQSCCCQAEPDPNQIVKCCYGGVCAEITAAECAFLGGYEVNDCADCPQEPGFPADECTECCAADEIDVTVTGNVNDPFCQAFAFGSLTIGRLGQSAKISASVTLQKGVGLFGSQCDYGFDGCIPGNGGFTRIQLSTLFSVQNGRCTFIVTQFVASLATCLAASGPDLSACTQPAFGGFCFSGTLGFGDVNSSSSPAECSGALSAQKSEVFVWADLNPNAAKGIVTGSPKIRDIGNVTCDTISSIPITEASYARTTRLSVRVE